jgi:hypothetical protein
LKSLRPDISVRTLVDVVSHTKGVVSVSVIAKALLGKLQDCVISVLPRREKPNDSSVRLADATRLACNRPARVSERRDFRYGSNSEVREGNREVLATEKKTAFRS